MSKSLPRRMPAELIAKLHDLAERRRAHVLSLGASRRWQRYYSEEEFTALKDDADQAADDWRQIATPPE